MEDGRVEARQGPADAPDVVVAGGSGTLLALCAGRLDLDEALGSGGVRIEGGGNDEAIFRCLRMLGSTNATV